MATKKGIGGFGADQVKKVHAPPETTPPEAPDQIRGEIAPRKEPETSETQKDTVKATYLLSRKMTVQLDRAVTQIREITGKRGEVTRSLVMEAALFLALRELKSDGGRSDLVREIRHQID